MSRRALKFIGIGAALLIVVPPTLCVGWFLFRLWFAPTPEARALDAVRAVGFVVADVADGPRHDGTPFLSGHKVFRTDDGRVGHVLRPARPIGTATEADSIAGLYLEGGATDNYVTWNSQGGGTIIVVLTARDSWSAAQRAALDGAIVPFK